MRCARRCRRWAPTGHAGSDSMLTVSFVGSTRMIMIVSECFGPVPSRPVDERLVVRVALVEPVAAVGPDDQVVLRLVGPDLGEADVRSLLIWLKR